MQLHPLALRVVLVPSSFVWETCSKHLDVHSSIFCNMTALDAIFVQQPSTFFHPASRVATVAHNIEVSTLEVIFVQTVYILKFHTPVLKNPATSSTWASMSSVPDKYYTNNIATLTSGCMQLYVNVRIIACMYMYIMYLIILTSFLSRLQF
jgi:hypothetical protein